jgi:hypothetical protein
MSNRKIIFASALVAAGMAAPVLADTNGELEALKARLAQLEAQQGKVDGAIAQSQAIDAAVIDASKRQFLMLDGMSGYDGGFKIGSADGNYVLQPYAEFQFRNVTNFSDAGDGDFGVDDEDDIQNGFEVRRMKIGLKGNIVNDKLKYNFRFAFDRDGGSAELDYAYLTYELNDQMTVKAGQFKGNVFHEETMGDTRQLAAERSLFNQVLGGGNLNYVQGVALEWGEDDSPLQAEVAYIDGEGSANTDYTDSPENFGVTARVEYKFSGNWKNYSDFTAKGTEEDLLVVGGGGSWSQTGSGDVYRLTADVQWENTGGLGVYGAGIYNYAEDETDLHNWGLLAQVGYMLPNAENWEVFGRGSAIFADAEDEAFGEDQYWEFNVGVNKYFSGHNAKFTLDAGWLPEGSPTGASGLGITGTGEDQIYVRAQIQLLI